jgi:phosphoglycerate dehydrogenase-like enzyme
MAIKVLYAVPTAHEAIMPVLERLRAEGCELTFNRTGRTLTEDELIELLPGAFATIAGGEPYTERVFAAAPELKVVARMGVGYDKVDVPAATRHGVAICMGFGTNHQAVADHAFALMAGLANRLLPYHQEVMEGRWGGHFQPGLWRTTVGIVGSAGSAGRSPGAVRASTCGSSPMTRRRMRAMPTNMASSWSISPRCSARPTSSRSTRRSRPRPKRS